MKLKTILLLNENSENWDGVTEGNGWFCYREANDWHTKRSGASVYITEGEPHKYWIKIKTHGLRKPTDTHESYRQRVRKHTDKITRNWITTARKLHNNPELNEVGNEIKMTWKECFRRALDEPSVSGQIAEWGEEAKKKDRQPAVDAVNFTNIAESVEEDDDMGKPYAAVILDDASHKKLTYGLESQIPDDWKVIAHHMTIQYPGVPDDVKKDIGKTVTLTATEIGKSNLAIAVRVTGYESKNKIPHVTIAINEDDGGQAKNSNDIKNWTKLSKPITLTGKVEEAT